MEDQITRILNEKDGAILWFPRVFNCIERKHGPSGTIERKDILCYNSLASWVEAFFIANIFVLWILACLWVLDFISTTTYLACSPLYQGSKKNKTQGCYTFNDLSMSKRLFVILLAQNMEPLFWEDVVNNILSTRNPNKYTNFNIEKKNKHNKLSNVTTQHNTHSGNTRQPKTANNRESYYEDNEEDLHLEMDEIRSLKDNYEKKNKYYRK